MELEASLPFDFRVRALLLLLERLEQLAAGLNLPGSSFTRQERSAPMVSLPLFPEPIYVLVGPTCAGKTTAASFLETSRGWAMIEASAIMRQLATKIGVETLPGAEMAARVTMEYGRSAVAEKIAERIRPNEQYVISGFRFVEEFELLTKMFPGRVRMVFVDAPIALRLSRALARGRIGDDIRSLDDLAAKDGDQNAFGLIPIARRFADHVIDNVGLVEDFYTKLDAVVIGSSLFVSAPPIPRSIESEQALRCLKVLAQTKRPMTNEEIAAQTGRFGPAIRHNNVNKVLKRIIGLVRRIEIPRRRVQYEILPAGFAYIQLADSVRSDRLEDDR